MSDLVGKQLGNYRLERELAKGAFGTVYLGEHIHLGVPAAIKVLSTQLAQEDIEQFRNEARTIARLVHPHIVRILEFGVEGNTPFLVMDYAPNGTLRERHPKGTQLPPTTIVSYVKQIADALQYAHDNKLIHRDVKPENMLVGRHNELLLSDFGIALIAQSSRYQAQDVAGTIGYMAPEQIQGDPHRASDQYALGIVVYEWISGDRPFHGAYAEVAAKHTAAPPLPLHEKVPMIPPDVELVVMTALEKDPQKRFGSVKAFARALEQACTRVGILKQDPEEAILTHISDKLQTPSSQPLAPTPPVPQPLSKEPRSAPPGIESTADKEVVTIRIGKPRLTHLIAAPIGIILYSLLIARLYPIAFDQLIFYSNPSYNNTAFNAYDLNILGALALFGLFEVVPLFFGAIFASLVGLLVGGVGFFIGTYYSMDFRINYGGSSISDYFGFYNQSHIWGVLLYMAFIGFAAGFMPLRILGWLNISNDLLCKLVSSFAGVIIGVSLLLFTSNAMYHQPFMWPQLLLYEFVLPGLVLLPFALWGYGAVVKRIQAGRPSKAGQPEIVKEASKPG